MSIHDEAIKLIEQDIAKRCEELLEIATNSPFTQTEYRINPITWQHPNGGDSYLYIYPESKQVAYPGLFSPGLFSYDNETLTVSSGDMYATQNYLKSALPKLKRRVRREERKLQKSVKKALGNCTTNPFLLPRKSYDTVFRIGSSLIFLTLITAAIGTFIIKNYTKPCSPNCVFHQISEAMWAPLQ